MSAFREPSGYLFKFAPSAKVGPLREVGLTGVEDGAVDFGRCLPLVALSEVK